MKLYHFSSGLTGDKEILDPMHFVTNRKNYSRKDYQLSECPRVFFYLDPNDKESMVNGNLYMTEVPDSDIITMRDVPEEIIRMSKSPTIKIVDGETVKTYDGSGPLDYDQLLRNISGWDREKISKWKEGDWYKKGPGICKGFRYGNAPEMVVYFEKIQVTRLQSRGAWTSPDPFASAW